MTGQYLALGCYGKLPFWPEYLSENAGYPTSQAFRTWLHGGRCEYHGPDSGTGGVQFVSGDSARKGHEGTGARETALVHKGCRKPDEGRARERLSRRFLFGMPGSMELMAGVVRPSSDQGGLRNFPFMVFVQFPRRLYGKHYNLLPLGLAPVWDALDAAWESLSIATSQSAFREVVGSTRIMAPADPEQIRNDYRIAMSEGSGGIFEMREGETLGALTRNLTGLFKELRSRPDDLLVEMPVRTDLESACYDSTFWIDLVNEQFLLKRFEPLIFLDESTGRRDRSVLMLFGALREADYPLLLGCGAESRPVLRPALGESGVDPGDPTYAELLARKYS